MTSVFTFLIFQGFPQYNKVYYWVDGSASKKIASSAEFLQTVTAEDPELLGIAKKAITTYSFYLYSKPDHRIQNLPPKTVGAVHADSVMEIISKEIATHDTQSQEKNLAAYLAGLGFNEPATGFEHLKRLFDEPTA